MSTLYILFLVTNVEQCCSLSFGPFSSRMGDCPGSLDYLHVPPYVWSFSGLQTLNSCVGLPVTGIGSQILLSQCTAHPSASQLHDFVTYHMRICSLTYMFIVLVNFYLFKINDCHISGVHMTLCLVHYVIVFTEICSSFTVSHSYLNLNIPVLLPETSNSHILLVKDAYSHCTVPYQIWRVTHWSEMQKHLLTRVRFKLKLTYLKDLGVCVLMGWSA